jgi:signal transduction histidine kinase/CheY-like chemotaxis protein
MISSLPRVLLRVTLALLLGACSAYSRAAEVATSVDLATSAHGLLVDSQLEMCIAEAAVQVTEIVQPGACDWRQLSSQDRFGGIERRAIWLRAHFSNTGDQPLRRWLKLGHARTTERSLFALHDNGEWSVQHTGLAVPLVARSTGEAGDNGFLELRVAPGETLLALIRVRSDSVTDLRSKLLDPAIERRAVEQRKVWVILAVGGIVLGTAFALLMFARSREFAYLYFATALIGEALLILSFTGILQSDFWPVTRPVPDAVISVAGALILVGWVAFLFEFLPQLRRYRRTLLICATLVALQVASQLYSIFVDFSRGSYFWLWLFLPTQLCAIVLCSLGIRTADRSSRILLSLLIAVFAFGIFRVVFSRGLDFEGVSELEFVPIALLLGLPLVLFSLSERSRELRGKLAAAQASGAAQVEFLARMSHELRTPLDTVLGNAQLLMRSQSSASSAATLQGLRSIVESARHLLGMIDEILDYARGQAGALRLCLDPVRISEFLSAIEATGQIFAARNRNRFVVRAAIGSRSADDTTLSIDEGRLRQVIDNLLVNAARHTRDGLIVVEYAIAETLDGRMRVGFSVSDTGEGIAPEDQQRIFKPFQRAGRGVRDSSKGVGMGLPTAQLLVKLMGGEIELESVLGQGSRFFFSIIVDQAPPNSPQIPVSIQAPFDAIGYAGPRKSILLVDDERSSRMVLAALLGSLGFRVLEVDSGRAAIELLAELDELDLVITDQFMSDGDGWDVLEAVLQRTPPVPTVLVSAALPSPPDGWPLNRGFDGSFLKPLEHDELLGRIAELLNIEWMKAVPAPKTLPVDLTKPPVPELQLLGQMVDLGEVTAIRDWIRNLRMSYPDCSAFADEVDRAVEMLDMAQLNALLGRKAN